MYTWYSSTISSPSFFTKSRRPKVPWLPAAMMNLTLSLGTPASLSVSNMSGAYWWVLVGLVMSSKITTASSHSSAISLRGLEPMGLSKAALICSSVMPCWPSQAILQRLTAHSSGKSRVSGLSSYQAWLGT